MKRQIRTVLGVVVILSFCLSCRLESLRDPIVVADIPEEFYVDLWEQLSPSRKLFFRIETIKEEECLNYSIDFDFSRQAGNLNISLDDIVSPADCDPGTGPARADISTGVLEPALYKLSIDLRNTVLNKGQLDINSEFYDVTMESEAGLVFRHKRLYHIPEGAFWGYLAYPEGQTATVQALNQRLWPLMKSYTYRSGYYGHFTYNNDTAQKIYLTQEPAFAHYFPFLFQLDAPKADLAAAIRSFRTDHPELLELKVFTWDGDTY